MVSIFQIKTDREMDAFITMQFEEAKENNAVDTAKSHSEQVQAHRDELIGFIDSKQKTAIFFAEDEQGLPQGYLWVSERGYQYPWDCQPDPAWIYDVRVSPEYRGRGIGYRLMQTAEAWASQKKFSRIGLHVFGFNQAAINLYGKLDYTTINSNVQKDIRERAYVFIPNNERFELRSFEISHDKSQLITLWRDNFHALARDANKTRTELIKGRFQNFIKDIAFDNSDIETFVVTDGNGHLHGFIRLTAVDKGDNPMAWINSIEAAQGVDQAPIMHLLLEYADYWAYQKRIGLLRAPSFGNSIVHFSAAGYKQTNLYMFKALS